jgi:hypothetical protein
VAAWLDFDDLDRIAREAVDELTDQPVQKLEGARHIDGPLNPHVTEPHR